MTNNKKPFKKGYKYRIYPTETQIELINKTFGCCRYVYNRALAESKIEYKYYLSHKDISAIIIKKPSLSGFSFVNKLPLYKIDPECLWLNNVSAVALQQSMLQLGKAFDNFFKLCKGYPKFKSKNGHQSFTLRTNSFKLKDNELFIIKSKEALKVKWSRKLPSVPNYAVISRTPSGKYFISFNCEHIPVSTNGIKKIGIDLGLKDFLASSDGNKVPNPKHLKYRERQLRRLQQSLAKKKKGSKNRNKARLKVATCHERITNCRNDFLHKLSRTLVNENQVIGVEKLKVKNMVRNHKLAKSISDASWSRFCTMLNYKTIESQHCTLVYMDCWYPSTHICSDCDIKLDYKLKLSQREWVCPSCSSTHDRDVNAAKNILKKSLSTLVTLVPPANARIVLAEA